ncbi:uncharacterized protein LOC129587308 isoform X2 [Paramacrobiotus metropolitanus]|nr:uncharacterized protein LOC129587308 isoform X2 [Paramacrobiotus metropolitanus]
MSLRTPSFRRRLVGADGINYQNTVVVWVEGRTFWLGFIQDIHGAFVYIHFDSSQAAAAPCWLHASCVWPLQMWRDSPDYFRSCTRLSGVVFAALRDEDDGPFRFRPAVYLGAGDLTLPTCYIRLTGETAGSAGASPVVDEQRPVQVVDDGQVIHQLPCVPSEPPLLELDKTHGLLYTKHVIPLTRAQLTLNAASDAAGFIAELRAAYKGHALVKRLQNPCRFHLHIGAAECTVIIISQQTDPATLEGTRQLLQRILDKYRYTATAASLPVQLQPTNCSPNAGPYDGQRVLCELQTDMEAGTSGFPTWPGLGRLPAEVLLTILANLDVHSQAIATRQMQYDAHWHNHCFSDHNVRLVAADCGGSPLHGAYECRSGAADNGESDEKWEKIRR